MRRFFISSKYRKLGEARINRQTYFQKLKSKRPSEYLHEQTINLRRRVLLYLGVILIIYLICMLFYSENFKIKYLQIIGQTDIPAAELTQVIWSALAKNSWLIFPQDNYFLMSKKKLQKNFQKQYPLDDLVIVKIAPHTLKIQLTERTDQLIWVAAERIFLFNPQGKIIREILAKEMVNTGRPVIYDEANTALGLSDQILNSSVIAVISELYSHFGQFGLPGIEIASFKLNRSQPNLLKISTKQGFEIHLDSNQPLNAQLSKLRRSLEADKIDLSKVQYINLRIENQVIYK